MWMQQGHIWHLGKIEFSVDMETWGENTQLMILVQVWSQSSFIFTNKIRHL